MRVVDEEDHLDSDENEYNTCVNCGRSVVPDIGECPYCHKHPRGDYDVCSYCGANLMSGVARCPECGKYTDGGGRQQGGRIPTIYVIAGILVVICFLLPMLLELLARL